MALITYLILLHILKGALSKECLNKVPLEYAWEKQILRDLNRSYKPVPPPSNNSAPLEVSLRFIMKSFQFQSDEEVFSMNAWMFISWKDERLKWDPQSYGGVKETIVTSPSIWVPSFRLFNSADGNDFDRFFYVRCNLKSSGWVYCVPREQHSVTCSVGLTNWPYDRQKCSVIYGAWSQNYCQIRLSFESRAISMIGAEYGAEWTIVDYEQIENQDSDKQLTMTFVLDREAESLAAILLYPSYILTALNVLVSWMDVRKYSRLYLACLSVLCHFYYLVEMGNKIPKESMNPPILLLYYRASVILSMFSAFVTIFLAFLCKRVTKPYDVIVTVDNLVYKSYGRFLIYPKWYLENVSLEKEEINFGGNWTRVANLINNLYAVIVMIVYVILYCTFIPQPKPWIN